MITYVSDSLYTALKNTKIKTIVDSNAEYGINFIAKNTKELKDCLEKEYDIIEYGDDIDLLEIIDGGTIYELRNLIDMDLVLNALQDNYVSSEYRGFNHTAHKELWNWLVENPDKCMNDWPRLSKNGGDLHCNNFMCYYADIIHSPDKRSNYCDCCPIEGFGDSINCEDIATIINKTNNKFIIKAILEAIKNLPIKKGVSYR